MVAGDDVAFLFIYHLIHMSFQVWKIFVLYHYPARMAFRTGLRTGNFCFGWQAFAA